MTMRLYRLPPTLYDEWLVPDCWTIHWDFTDYPLRYTMTGKALYVGLWQRDCTDYLLFYTMTGKAEHFGYDTLTLQTTLYFTRWQVIPARWTMTMRLYRLPSTIHDDRLGSAHWIMTLRLYRLLSTLHDDRLALACWTVTLRLYRLPSTQHDDRLGPAHWTMTLRLYRLLSTLHDDR